MKLKMTKALSLLLSIGAFGDKHKFIKPKIDRSALPKVSRSKYIPAGPRRNVPMENR